MDNLLAVPHRHGEFVPFTGWGKPAEIEKAAAIQGRVGNPHDSSQTEQRLFIDFVSAHQIGVVAEITKKPPKFPKCFGGAVETTVKGTALMFSWLEDSEPQNVERSLRMPAVEGPIDTDQENALQDLFGVVAFAVQAWNVTLHERTSCCWM